MLPRQIHTRSEEHTSELQSRLHLVCRLLLGNKEDSESRSRHARRRDRVHAARPPAGPPTASPCGAWRRPCVRASSRSCWSSIFFFNDTATTEIYPLSLHDALPIFISRKTIGLRTGIILASIYAVSIALQLDRKSTRLNSSHGYISYAVFCLKKKKKQRDPHLSHNEQPAQTLPR